MIKNKEPKEVVIDLTGPNGNSFSLLGYAKSLCKQLKIDYTKVSTEMMSGDYENLVQVFDDYFGKYVTLYR